MPRDDGKLATAQGEWVGRSLIAVWIVIMVIVMASLALQHSVALPRPDDESRLTSFLLKLRRSGTRNFVVHVIYSDCSCSKALLTHLITRHSFSKDEELVLFVGASSGQQKSVERSGFEFAQISSADLLSGAGLAAAPVLAIFDLRGKLRYVGGYFDRPAEIVPLDEGIYARLAAGHEVAPLPIFGCAISPRS